MAHPGDHHDKAIMSFNRDQVLDPPFEDHPPLCRILDLPPELVKVVFDKLGSRTLLASRRVCRAFRDLSLTTLGLKFFEYVVVIIRPVSLVILELIADNTAISEFVHHLTVSGEEIGGVIDMSDQQNA
jgi:hypothetical protein